MIFIYYNLTLSIFTCKEKSAYAKVRQSSSNSYIIMDKATNPAVSVLNIVFPKFTESTPISESIFASLSENPI